MKALKKLFFIGLLVLALALALASCRGMFDSIGDELGGGGHDAEECEHDYYIISESAPTCTDAGHRDSSCRKCGENLYETLEATGHTETQVAAIPATCTTSGIGAGVRCSVCNEAVSGFAYIEELGHDEVIVPAVPPTCTEDGMSEKRHCSRCDVVFAQGYVLNATGHESAYEGYVDPTCTEEGCTAKEYCSNCGTVLAESEVIPATGHGYLTTLEGYAATCTEDGLSEGSYCHWCETTVVEQNVIPAAGHKLVREPSVTPTCASSGYVGGLSCETCGVVLQKGVTLEKTGHRFIDGKCTCNLIASVGLAYEYSESKGGYVLVGIGSFEGSEIVVPDTYEGKSIVAIADGAFRGNTQLTRVTVTGEVSSVGEEAFSGCTSLVSIDLPTSVVSVEKNAFDGCIYLEHVNCGDFDQTLTWSKECFGSSTPVVRAAEKNGMTPYEVFLFAMAHVRNNLNRYKMVQTYSIVSTMNGQSFPDGTTSYYTVTESAGPYEIYQYNGQTNECVWLVDNVCYYRNSENSYKWAVGNEYIREQTSIAANSMPNYTEDFFKGAEFVKNTDGTYTLYVAMNEENMAEMVKEMVGEAVLEDGYFEFCRYVYRFDENGYILDVQADAVFTIPVSDGYVITATYDISTSFSDVGTLESVTAPSGFFTDISRTNCYCTESMEIVVPGVAPTCMEKGMSDGIYCKNCFKDKVVSFELLPLNHKFEDGVCTECGEFKNASAGLSYEFNADGLTCTVSGIGDCKHTEVIIPDRIYGVKVVGIESGAFKNCTQITSITIPETVIVIGEDAFDGCTNLWKITSPLSLVPMLPKNISEIVLLNGEVIDADDFAGFASLSALTLPETLTGIEDGAFAACDRIYVVVNNSLLPIEAGQTNYGGVARNALEVVSKDGTRESVIVGDFLFVYVEHYDGNDRYALKKYLGNDKDVVVTGIPGAQVIGIHSGAFEGCSFVETITFSNAYDNVGTIESFAGLTGVKKVVGNAHAVSGISYVSDLLRTAVITGDTVGDYALSGNTKLESITLSEGVTSIGYYAFNECTALKEIILPSTLEYIGNRAFSYTAITEIVIPEGITELEEFTFMGCEKLSKVTLPSTLKTVGGFKDCTSLHTLELPDGLDMISRQAFMESGLKFLVIPDSVNEIGEDAFFGCYIYSLTIGSGVGVIWTPDMFYGVELINRSTIVDLSGLEGMLEVHTGESKLFEQDGYYFYEKEGTTYLVGYLGESTVLDLPVPEGGGTYEIAKGAFSGRTDITEIRIDGDHVTRIGANAFYGCTSVERIYYNASAVTDAANAFYAYDIPSVTLAELVIGKDVTEIPDSTFFGAHIGKLTFEEGSTCQKIGEQAFKASLLTEIEFPPSLLDVEALAFECYQLTKINYNCTYVCAFDYRTFSRYSQYDGKAVALHIGKDVREFPSGFISLLWVTELTFDEGCRFDSIGGFREQPHLTHVEIPEGVREIENTAFYECPSLVSVRLPSTVEIIGENAFYGCTKLSEISLPETGMRIGVNAFYNTVPDVAARNDVLYIGKHLIKAYFNGNYFPIREGTVSIAAGAFEYKPINSLTIPEGVTHIGDGAFYGCTVLSSISLPDSLAWIGVDLFGNCGSLAAKEENGIKYLGNTENPYVIALIATITSKTSYELPEGVRVIYQAAFEYCSAATSITLPSTLRQIGNDAFEMCTALENVTIPEGVTSIGSRAFKDCAMTEVEVPEGVTEIGAHAFSSCEKLASVSLPSTLRDVGEFAFGWCTSLKTLRIPEGVSAIGTNLISYSGVEALYLPATLMKADLRTLVQAEDLQTVYFSGNEARWAVLTLGVDPDTVTWTVEFVTN